jgi:ABC-type branched-subunit amino acid transport system substrate-binding protein
VLGLFITAAVSASSQSGALTGEESRGKQILGNEIVALLGKDATEVPASVLSCASCHGRDGRGKPEGGVKPSDITWETLTRPYSSAIPGRRRHPPYSERALRRAISMGIDSGGNRLDPVMPRYRMSIRDMADLTAYIKRLGSTPEPGITQNEIRIGAFVLERDESDDVARALKAALAAYFEEVNKQGGIHHRKLALVVPDPAPDAADPAVAFRNFIETQAPFTLTASILSPDEHRIAAIADEKEVPVVGALATCPQTGFPLNRYVFYLYGGISSQVASLAAFATMKFPARSKSAVIVDRSPGSRQALEAVRGQLEKAGWSPPIERASPPDGNIAGLIKELSDTGVQAIFLLVAPGASEPVFRQSAGAGWTPAFLIPGSLGSATLLNAPDAFDGKVHIAYPTLPADHDPAAMAEYRWLAQTHRLPAQGAVTQLAALSSAKILVEALKRAGRDVTREKLIEALEGFYSFRTGLTPAVTFGANRRLGADGAYIVSIDVKNSGRRPEWVEPR